MSKPLTIITFFEKYKNDEVCLEHIMKVRYGLVSECPKCGRESHFYRLKKRPAYSCAHCGHHIYPCSGTPFAKTRTPLRLWFYAIYLFTTTRHGVSAKELQRQLGVTYKTAWRMGHEIRKYMAHVDGNDDLSGHVEIDETYVGGRARGKGRGPLAGGNKTIVLGMVERGGSIMTQVVPDVKRATLLPRIKNHIKKGSLLNTDELQSYATIAKHGYAHSSVKHSEEEWVRGDTHINTLEGYWSHFKSGVLGTHRSISRRHMMSYLGEFEFRFNRRREVSGRMFDQLIKAF
jgi:transposase